MAQMEQVLWGEGSTPATSRAAVQPKEEKDSIAALLPMFSSSPLPSTEISPPLEAEKNSRAEIRSPAKTLLLSPILLVLPSSLRPMQFRLPCRDESDADFDGLDLGCTRRNLTVYSSVLARAKNQGKERGRGSISASVVQV